MRYPSVMNVQDQKKDPIKVRHLQSSTQIIEMDEIKILTDPWLTEGEYYGSWYHFPAFPETEISKLDYDFIYVSHIHPDHLSEKTFRLLSKRVPVLIHTFESKFLKRKLESMNFDVIECKNAEPYIFQNGSSITIFAADNCNPVLCAKFLGCATVESKFGSTQIDTLALFENRGVSVLNTNDCPIELTEETIKVNKINKKNIDLLLVGYGGAGPYPQCFEFDSEQEKIKEAKLKEEKFLNQSLKYIDLIKPKAFAPYAGTYILGSKLVELNRFRGVPSVKDATDFLNGAVSSPTLGITLELFDEYLVGQKIHLKDHSHKKQSFQEFLDEIKNRSLDYESDTWNDEDLPELIHLAYGRFSDKCIEIGYQSDASIIIETESALFSMSPSHAPCFEKEKIQLEKKFVKITLSHNLLHRLLRGPRFAHWNNAEIGSHLKYKRNPNVFERGLYHALCYFHQ